MESGNAVLQYGALGVLFAVLLAVLAGVKLLFDREYKLRQKAQEFNHRQWESSMEFIQQLATRAMASQDEQINAWRTLVEQFAATSSQVSTALTGACARLNNLEAGQDEIRRLLEVSSGKEAKEK